MRPSKQVCGLLEQMHDSHGPELWKLALPRVMLNLKSRTNTVALERNILSNLDTKGVFTGCLLIVPTAALWSGQRAALSSTSCSLHIICQLRQDKMVFHGMPCYAPFSSQRSCPLGAPAAILTPGCISKWLPLYISWWYTSVCLLETLLLHSRDAAPKLLHSAVFFLGCLNQTTRVPHSSTITRNHLPDRLPRGRALPLTCKWLIKSSKSLLRASSVFAILGFAKYFK